MLCGLTIRHLIEYITYSNVQQYITVAASVMLDSNNSKLSIMEITTRLLSKDDWPFIPQSLYLIQKPIIIRPIALTVLLCAAVDMYVEVIKTFMCVKQ